MLSRVCVCVCVSNFRPRVDSIDACDAVDPSRPTPSHPYLDRRQHAELVLGHVPHARHVEAHGCRVLGVCGAVCWLATALVTRWTSGGLDEAEAKKKGKPVLVGAWMGVCVRSAVRINAPNFRRKATIVGWIG